MTGSIALDVVIGLVFIYLLYSLLATIIVEIIAVRLSLRAKNLKEAINRMLADEPSEESRNWRKKVSDWIIRNPTLGPEVKWFYQHQEIKYLGKKADKHPSAIKAQNFAKVLIDRLKSAGKEGTTNLDKIKLGLENTIKEVADERILGKDTADYILSVLEDCQNDLDKFREKLEAWFDQTMEHAAEWYKQRIQKVLLIIGLLIAWWFNVDTIQIVKTLSVDKDARQEMVQLASSFMEEGKYEYYQAKLEQPADSNALITYKARLDTALKVKKELQADIQKANDVMGLGSWLPDTLVLTSGKIWKVPTWVDLRALNCVTHSCDYQAGKVSIGTVTKIGYFLVLPFYHFLGYLLTALAISLGAPFWFDLLNKLMKLRGTVKGEEPAKGQTASANTAINQPKRVG